MISFGLAEQRLGDTETLLHSSGVGAQGLLARIPQIGLVQYSLDHLLALSLVGHALHHGKVLQQIYR